MEPQICVPCHWRQTQNNNGIIKTERQFHYANPLWMKMNVFDFSSIAFMTVFQQISFCQKHVATQYRKWLMLPRTNRNLKCTLIFFGEGKYSKDVILKCKKCLELFLQKYSENTPKNTLAMLKKDVHRNQGIKWNIWLLIIPNWRNKHCVNQLFHCDLEFICLQTPPHNLLSPNTDP